MATAEILSPFSEAEADELELDDEEYADLEEFGTYGAFEEEDELPEDHLLEVALEDEHPLAAVFDLPRLAFDAMAKGGWTTAIAMAIGAGVRDVNKLTNLVFWFRHPSLIGQKLRADQRDLTSEWLRIRDQIVRPALAGQTPTPIPAPGGGRTSMPAANLRWFGPASEETPELMAFLRNVYERHVRWHISRGDSFVDTLPEQSLGTIEGGHKARADAAAKAIELLAAARAALATTAHAGKIRIGITSAYRSADQQWGIWQGQFLKGKGGFPHYYQQTRRARQGMSGGEHGEQAAAYLASYLAQYVAAPGYSNHQDGLALDLGTGPVKGHLGKLGTKAWFHTWLTENAGRFHFQPYKKEAWHWTYRPPAGASEAWEAETATPIEAGRLEVASIPLLRSHRGQAPDLVLGWNAMSSMPAELDVVVHLHGYSFARMTLPKNMEVWAGLDLAPVDGASGTGRTRPTLTVLPRGHFTGVQVGKIYRYTFPALVTKDGLTTLVREALQRFAERVGGIAPTMGRLIVTAHSGGGAPLMQILRHHDPQEVHVFDGLYQDVSALATWARRHLQADREAGEPTGAMRVFYGRSTKGYSLQLHKALAAGLRGAPESVLNRYRVEASSLGHWQIARQYGWRMLADPAADVPNASRPTAAQAHEVDPGEMPFETELDEYECGGSDEAP
ncbi:D-alanyl-D-alanine carboxypeptidase family protein [Tenggerimyces flavus]|uniref:D-alanyl-D-alanine carboxypeptidase family protein n=1 Tax=Tenggerimyces flavus TaxID=1708749 RepID=A0ABV7YNZ9_9ACTN|nr:D-alanyl-D-alanine carboxypeptidase family protein [Tenggerimyces flavus]MBM7784425.1 LAS superfamily LD-carboxypeptidase LdcB [Tenggerimyces flavus]